jgi:Uma2 family endonuclease
MGIPKTANRLTVRDYYVMERAADFKSEFFEGEVFAMAGGSTRHSFIKTQLSAELRTKLRAGGGCRPCDSDQRVKIIATGLRTYPDVSVFCGPLEYDDEDDQKETATNPTALFEVLSDSTEAYDRGTKAEHYRKIPSLKAYALLSQNAPHIELFERQADGSWSLIEASGMNSVLHMSSLGIDLSLGEIYEQIEFPETVLKVVPLKH